MLDKKQISVIFSFEFKMGCKSAETTHNTNNTFGPGTANEHIVQWWFRQFCKGDDSPKDEEHSSWPSEIHNDQLRAGWQYTALTNLEPVCCSMSISNWCFLTCVQISQEVGQVVWYSHLFQNFPQFIVNHTVKGFGIVNKAEIEVFLELSCFCWHIECSTFIASSFRIWNSSTSIPSPPLALLVVMLPKAYLTLHSRMSGSRWVLTPS